LRARRDDVKEPVLELAGVNDGRVVAGRTGPLDDPAVAGPREVEISRQPSCFMTAAGVREAQRVGAGLEQDGVVLGARVAVKLEDGVAQAAAALATVGEGRRREDLPSAQLFHDGRRR
jgi:hypothetical protein